MKNPDAVTKRFLSVCLGFSAVLISGSLFIFSLKTVTPSQASPLKEKDFIAGMNMIQQDSKLAKQVVTPADTSDANVQAVQAFGLGMRDGVIYFGILYNNNTIGLHKTEFNSEDILHW
jgi:hypothetical protein